MNAKCAGRSWALAVSLAAGFYIAAGADHAPGDLAATARAAIDAMRRGVVAYSAVAD